METAIETNRIEVGRKEAFWEFSVQIGDLRERIDAHTQLANGTPAWLKSKGLS